MLENFTKDVCVIMEETVNIEFHLAGHPFLSLGREPDIESGNGGILAAVSDGYRMGLFVEKLQRYIDAFK